MKGGSVAATLEIFCSDVYHRSNKHKSQVKFSKMFFVHMVAPTHSKNLWLYAKFMS